MAADRTVVRTGIMRTKNATRSGWVSLLVREYTDGSFEYLVGDSARNPNGWASLSDDLIAHVKWDPK
jgi:hypothetical protein